MMLDHHRTAIAQSLIDKDGSAESSDKIALLFTLVKTEAARDARDTEGESAVRIAQKIAIARQLQRGDEFVLLAALAVTIGSSTSRYVPFGRKVVLEDVAQFATGFPVATCERIFEKEGLLCDPVRIMDPGYGSSLLSTSLQQDGSIQLGLTPLGKGAAHLLHEELGIDSAEAYSRARAAVISRLGARRGSLNS